MFGRRKNQPRSIRTLPMQHTKKQMDPAYRFVENERQIWETQWAMSNLFRKIQNFQLFFDNKWPENFFGKIYLHKLLNWMLFHRLVQKY